MSKQEINDTWSGSIDNYKMVVEGCDWGPGVTALIIDLGDEKVVPAEINMNDFEVSVLCQKMDSTGTTTCEYEQRVILSVYASDAEGNKISEFAAHITVELEVSPNFGNPFFFDKEKMGNNWSDPYEHRISYKGIKFVPKRINKLMPLTDLFDINGKFTGSDGEELLYAAYSPDTDDKRPLIIWLHGLGEGSMDGVANPEIALLGNRVTRFVDDEIQGLMGGAHVLVPQASTFWMDEGTFGNDRQPTTTGYSRYETALTELLKEFIANNQNIDLNRVYISGCSNGGFMTLRMMFLNPEMFAGAIPICHGYHEDWLTEEKIESIKAIPIWIVHTKNDDALRYEKTAQPLYERLIAAGAENIFFTLDENVVDRTGLYFDEEGNPYEYNGHLSWIHPLNNDTEMKIAGEVVSIFKWLSMQKRNLKG